MTNAAASHQGGKSKCFALVLGSSYFAHFYVQSLTVTGETIVTDRNLKVAQRILLLTLLSALLLIQTTILMSRSVAP